MNVLGEPDNGVVAASYIGSLLMAGAFLAIGSCMSALTRNQVVAFILAAAVCFLFTMAGLELVQNTVLAFFPPAVADTVGSFSFLSHFGAISKGVIDGRDAVFFMSMILILAVCDGRRSRRRAGCLRAGERNDAPLAP